MAIDLKLGDLQKNSCGLEGRQYALACGRAGRRGVRPKVSVGGHGKDDAVGQRQQKERGQHIVFTNCAKGDVV